MDNSRVWYGAETIDKSKSYVCAYCGENVCSNIGYHQKCFPYSVIYICHNCKKPTFFDKVNMDAQYPGPLYGKCFNLPIPDDVNKLYNEAREAYSVNAFTAVGMCCRKLLMNICVDLGAEEERPFVWYVDFLDKENYIPKGSKKWVDVIRKKGNDAAHEIKFLAKKDAEQLIDFSAIIINLVYENDLVISNED